MKRWLEDVRRDAICKLRKVTYEGKKLEDAVDGIMELYDISRAGGWSRWKRRQKRQSQIF